MFVTYFSLGTVRVFSHLVNMITYVIIVDETLNIVETSCPEANILSINVSYSTFTKIKGIRVSVFFRNLWGYLG